MPEESLASKIEERAAALSKPPAKRLHEVIAALKTACLRKRAAEAEEAPSLDPGRVDPDFRSNMKKLDVLNKARSMIRARKRKKAVPPPEATNE